VDGGSRRGYAKKCERDLRSDQNAPAMLCRSSNAANLPARRHTCGIVTRETQCGDKTEEENTADSTSATENARMEALMQMTDSGGKKSGESNKGSFASQ